MMKWLQNVVSRAYLIIFRKLRDNFHQYNIQFKYHGSLLLFEMAHKNQHNEYEKIEGRSQRGLSLEMIEKINIDIIYARHSNRYHMNHHI